MIPVVLQAEPPQFEAMVRAPGRAFLARTPRPTSKQFKGKDFWKSALPDLKVAYSSICAYSCIWMPSNCSVDHFHPKSVRPDLAYEWSNYRLAHDKINCNKGDSTAVLDPFYIQAGWFVLDLATLWIRPDNSLQPNVKASVQKTIDVLRLNDEQWVQMRFELYKSYVDGDIGIAFLQRNYPFIAAEVRRQNVVPKQPV